MLHCIVFFLQIHKEPTRASVRQGGRAVRVQLGSAKLVLSKRVGELKINKALIQRYPMVAAEVLMSHTFLIDSYEVNKSDRAAAGTGQFCIIGRFCPATLWRSDSVNDVPRPGAGPSGAGQTLYVVVPSTGEGTRCGIRAAAGRVRGRTGQNDCNVQCEGMEAKHGRIPAYTNLVTRL